MDNNHKPFLYVGIAVLHKMTCAVSIQLQYFCRVLCEFVLFKFRQCEDYSEQSKRFFEPLTFAERRCNLVKMRDPWNEVGEDVHLNLSVFTLFIYTFIEYF